MKDEVLGRYALHISGNGPLMKITGTDIDNYLSLRYRCEWKENCRAMSTLFRLQDLHVFAETMVANEIINDLLVGDRLYTDDQISAHS